MTGYNQAQQEKIKAWDSAVSDTVQLDCRLTGSEQDGSFEALADQLEQLAHHVNIKRSREPVIRFEKNLPGLLIKDNILYSALPFERELGVFLKGLGWLNDLPGIDDDIRKLLEALPFNVPLKLYIAQACPHCPALVETTMLLAMHSEKILLEIIDGSMFVKAAQDDQVMAAPCLILDNDFRWTGQVSALEICRMMGSRDPSQLSTQSLRSILEDGRASWIADQMIERDEIFEGFFGLLLHEIWSVRLGAMVIVEQLAEEKPDLAKSLCDRLVSEFERHPVTIQGDILYALGEAGSLETIGDIEKLLETIGEEELKEAGLEALESLRERF
ncbi:MAG: hypothetical protein D3926_16205 [Desulfobacteraceae bacterium]|nr:MAG: hypothetical protein D3926_16205 [Desulfobacteraceae bacterium]